jgi:hypothetical protein
MFLDMGDDGLRKFDPGMKVGCGCVKPLGEDHVLEDLLAVARTKGFDVVVQLGVGDSEKSFGMGPLACYGLVETIVGDIPLRPSRGLK